MLITTLVIATARLATLKVLPRFLENRGIAAELVEGAIFLLGTMLLIGIVKPYATLQDLVFWGIIDLGGFLLGNLIWRIWKNRKGR